MKRLKELREAKGLLQKDVAEMLGVDRTTYVKYENGNNEPDSRTLIKLANFFEVSIDELFDVDVPSSAPTTKISTYLNMYLQKHKMRQKDFASLIGIQPNTLSQWVNGKRQPDYANLVLLAQTFEISVDALLGADPSNKNYTREGIQIALFGHVDDEMMSKVEDYINFLKNYKQKN